MRKILCTGGVTAAPLFIAASAGQVVDVPDELATKAVDMGLAKYADEKQAEKEAGVPLGIVTPAQDAPPATPPKKK